MPLRYSKIKLGLFSVLFASLAMAADFWVSGGFSNQEEIISTGIIGLACLIVSMITWLVGVKTSFEEGGVRQWLFLSERFIAWDEIFVEEFTWFRTVLKSTKSERFVFFLGTYFWSEKDAVLELLKQKRLI